MNYWDNKSLRTAKIYTHVASRDVKRLADYESFSNFLIKHL